MTTEKRSSYRMYASDSSDRKNGNTSPSSPSSERSTTERKRTYSSRDRDSRGPRSRSNRRSTSRPSRSHSYDADEALTVEEAQDFCCTTQIYFLSAPPIASPVMLAIGGADQK